MVKNSLVQSRRSPDRIPIFLIFDCCRVSWSAKENAACPPVVQKDESSSNVFIAYSTTKAEATGDNGAFTRYLLKYIDKGWRVEDIFVQVGRDLEEEPNSQVGD